MEKRVVVTGLGAITPIGNNVAELWEGIKTGKCGIDDITLFDTSNSKVKIAAGQGITPMYSTCVLVPKDNVFSASDTSASTQASTSLIFLILTSISAFQQLFLKNGVT